MAETLLQVGLHEDADTLSPIQLEDMQDQQFVSLGWPSATTCPPQSDDAVTRQGGRQKTTTQRTPPYVFEVRKGVRTRSFSKEDKQKINDMRKTRACLKCHLNKDECDNGYPCIKCSTRLRKWKLGCTRARFEDFEASFPPRVLRSDLNWQKVYSLINANATVWRGRPFEISIKQELGGPQPKLLRIRVCEADLLGDRLCRRPMQVVNGDFVETIHQESPPILPYYQDDPTKSWLIRDDILSWLHEVAETKTEDFHWHWYPEDDQDMWERSILGEICTYFHETSSSQVGDALLMTTLVYIMIHSFTIPEVEAEELYMGLSDERYHRKPTEEVSPRAVNKFVAMFLLPELVKISKKVLADLKEQLIDCRRSRDGFKISREVVFCEAYLTMMVIGHFQNTVLQYFDFDEVLEEHTISREEAEDEIRWLEELGNLVTELAAVRLRKDQPRLGSAVNESDVKSDSLLDRIRKATRESGMLDNYCSTGMLTSLQVRYSIRQGNTN